MKWIGIGSRVRIDIPDETDPDHERLHGEHGLLVRVIEDAAAEVTGDDEDNNLYRIKLDDGEKVDVRARDIRPAIE